VHNPLNIHSTNHTSNNCEEYTDLQSPCILDTGWHLKSPWARVSQPQPFKYFVLDAMGHSGKLHSFLTPQQKISFSFKL